MQYVNDDMDELFRRAAKDYPLNTDSSDWEKVKKGLSDPAAGGGNKPSNGNNRKHFLWLLMLLPLPWICDQYSGDAAKHNATAGLNQKAPTVNDPQKKITNADNSLNTPDNREDVSTSSYSSTANTSISNRNNHSTSYATVPVDQQRRGDGIPAQTTNDVIHNPSKETTLPRIDNENTGVEKVVTRTTDQSIPESTKTGIVTQKDEAASSEKKEETTIPDKQSVPQDSTTTAPAPQKQPKPSRQKRFYVGLIAGADVTSVKMQPVKKVGYDIGLLAGYALSNKWSIESGILSVKKEYYSDGEYLPKAYVLPGTKLKEANGDCRMWEVPLLVRYQFKEGRKGGWFAAVGATSYFMQEEDYYYTYYYTATGQEEERYRSYGAKSSHLFAAAQVSGGYSRQLGKGIELRAEPYIKLPLRKVGYYDLPLSSFGVHVGVTKKLF